MTSALRLSERDLLERLGQGPVSGDALARESGQTRAAVWKRIAALRSAGIVIDAQPGRGYRLPQALDLLDADAVRASLTPDVAARIAAVDIAWSIDSTNAELLRRATPATGAAVLLAERQSSGRGRRGRAWASPLACNVYLSLARTFSGGLARLGGLSLVAGIAAAEALRALGADAVQLKWPNDLVIVDGDILRKLGGVLVEGGGEHGGPVRAVIGLGINVRMPETFAQRIDQPWTDLAKLLPDATPSRNVIAAAVLGRLLPALDVFDAEGLAPFLSRHAALDALWNRAINIHAGDGVRTGIAQGLAVDGALRVRMADGMRILHAGEVSVRTT